VIPAQTPGIKEEKTMVRNYRLENLDCANCAAKMERKIQKLPGVASATVNFMTLKLTIDLDESREKEIMEQVEKAMKSVERDLVIRRA
jgi:cation transport ATPase